MKHAIIIIKVLILSSLYSCQDKLVTRPIDSNEQLYESGTIQLMFSAIEYDLYLGSMDKAGRHIMELKEKLESSKKEYYEGSTDQLTKITKDLEIYAHRVLSETNHWSLEKLRDLKGQFINLQVCGDHDMYLYHLWRFEEEMYYTTKAAIDPMLDLYEWGEFQIMVDCMNEVWEMVQRHYPSIELLGNNSKAYKLQTTKKIHLQESINRFNTAVKNDDYIQHDLCEYGEDLRYMYVEYIKSLVDREKSISIFLATL